MALDEEIQERHRDTASEASALKFKPSFTATSSEQDMVAKGKDEGDSGLKLSPGMSRSVVTDASLVEEQQREGVTGSRDTLSVSNVPGPPDTMSVADVPGPPDTMSVADVPGPPDALSTAAASGSSSGSPDPTPSVGSPPEQGRRPVSASERLRQKRRRWDAALRQDMALLLAQQPTAAQAARCHLFLEVLPTCEELQDPMSPGDRNRIENLLHDNVMIYREN